MTNCEITGAVSGSSITGNIKLDTIYGFVNPTISGSSLYIPYIGCLSNVDLGIHDLTSTGNFTAGNLSGTNTGDQESSDFDHDSLINTHNLTTDIDHDSITNTHNLTTDINHNALFNYVANEHIDWTTSQAPVVIHTDNYTNTTYTSADFNLSDLGDVVDTAKAEGKYLIVDDRGNHVYTDIDLSAYVPYTGATSNVALGAYDLSATDLTSSTLTVDTNTLVVNRAGYTDKVGINNLTPAYDLDVNGQVWASSGSFPVFGFERLTSTTGGSFESTSGIASAMQLVTTTSGDMGDAFGGGIVIYGKDSGMSVPGALARIYARRDGGDAIGAIQFMAGVNGATKFLTFRSSGYLGVNTGTPLSTLDVRGTGRIGDGSSNMTHFGSDGVQTMYGKARVIKNEWLSVAGIKLPATKPAVAVDWGLNVALEFSDGTDDTAGGSIRIPADMDRTVAPEFKIGFASDTNTGDVVWQLEYRWFAPNEDTTATAQETLSVETKISTTADGLTVATITGIDLPSSTDQLMRFRLKRLGADAKDTLADDCVLLGCGLKYVANKLGEQYD